MTDPSVIVPMKVNALVVNEVVRRSAPFKRYEPDYVGMIRDKRSAEPVNPVVGLPVTASFEGVHLKWDLPGSLTSGFLDPDTGESHFPLVPNRWLVVRYSGDASSRGAAGWIVHSDFLRDDYPESGHNGLNGYLRPDKPKRDRIGRVHDLNQDGPWQEPQHRDLFLTAVGPGLPAFAAFQPYHKGVFSFHDTLKDLEDPATDLFPPPTTLSYLVLGWYSDNDADLLTRAPRTPGLLPPDATAPTDVLTALGWRAPQTLSETAARSVYAGTALAVGWDYKGPAPSSDKPAVRSVKVSVGHSADEALAGLVTRQTGRERTGDLLRALYNGTAESLDEPHGNHTLDRQTHESWFAGLTGGHFWQIVPRTRDNAAPPAQPPHPQWLDALNRDQAAHDELTHRIAHTQWRAWTLRWLRELPDDTVRHGTRPPGFNEQAARELDPTHPGSLAEHVAALAQEATRLRDRLPQGATDEELQAAADRYAADRGLANDHRLQRAPKTSYYYPGDPVVVLEGVGNRDPLSRDPEDLLPLRPPSDLLTALNINGVWTNPPANPPHPTLAGLPDHARAAAAALLSEFALLDQAARTPGTHQNALEAIAADPSTLSRGPWPEYTGVWRQAWQPLFLEWDVRYCATPYQSEGTSHWTFDTSRLGYVWNGTGATTGNGEGNLHWNTFRARTTLAPSAPYVLRAQLARYLATHPRLPADRLRVLREQLQEIDVLSQTLQGFNDWLLRQDGTAKLIPDTESDHLVGTQDIVPVPGEGALAQTFQPVRAGQFFFVDLRVVDRFGQVLSITNENEYQSFLPNPAPSAVPDHPTSSELTNLGRFVQLPPRVLHAARLHFATPGAAAASDTSGHRASATNSPIAGWLLPNYLDHALLVHGPDGHGLGALRLTRDATGEQVTTWTALPFSPHPDPHSAAFARAYPHLAGCVRALLDQPGTAFTTLVNTIDQTLSTRTDETAHGDRCLARLVGHPLALLRCDLRLELQGPPITNPSWSTALNPPPEEYSAYTWPVRLGDPKAMNEGLIGYFASASGPGGAIDFTTFRALHPTSTDGYVTPISNGQDLALPMRPTDDPVTHQVVLLADPQSPVHAFTDVLPDQTLRLDPTLAQEALSNISVAFRMNPILASTRDLDPASTGGRASGPHLVMPQPSEQHGTFDWAEPRTDTASSPSWVELPLSNADTVDHPDDPPAVARSGYLCRRPSNPPAQEE